MRVEIIVYDDDEKTVAFATEDACKPITWRTHYDKPIQNPKFKFFGFTYQPIVTKQPLEPTL